MNVSTSMQAHINNLCMIANELANIHPQVLYGLGITLFKNSLPSFHTLVVLLTTQIDKLSMEFACEQLLQTCCKKNYDLSEKSLTIVCYKKH